MLEEFHQLWQAADYLTRGGVEYAQKLLVKSLGQELARRVLDRVVKSFESTMAFTALEKADPQQLSKFILTEHPQTIALILAHLKPAQASQLLYSLPEDLRVDVVSRMASLDEISPEVITRISSVIEQRLKSLGGSTHESYGGVRAVAELLNRIDRTVSQPVLEAIENQSPDLAVSIRNLMFVFDDLQGVEDSALREIIQRADKKVLTIALKGANEEIRTRFFSEHVEARVRRWCARRWKCSAPSGCARSRRRSTRSSPSRASSKRRVCCPRGPPQASPMSCRAQRLSSAATVRRYQWEGTGEPGERAAPLPRRARRRRSLDAPTAVWRGRAGARDAVGRAGSAAAPRSNARRSRRGTPPASARASKRARTGPTPCCAAWRRRSTTSRSCGARSRATPSTRWCSWRSRWRKRVVLRELSLDPDLVAALAHVAVERLGDQAPATIRLHPEDYATVLANRGEQWEGTQVSVVPDPAVQRGGCVVESDFGMIDASVDAQFAELSRALLGDPAAMKTSSDFGD